MILGAVMGGHLAYASAQCFWVVAWLVLITAVAEPLWIWLLKNHPVSQVTVYMFTLPLFGVLLTVLLLGNDGQAFQLKSLAALVLVCAGILIINLPGREKRSRKSQ